jgi:probable phosphoglycerate mutase
MAATLHLMRHAEPLGAGEGRYLGWLDRPLSDEGRRQMAALAHALAADAATPRWEAVYSSDLQRSVESAAILGERFGLAPVPVPELRERNFGRWEGLRLAEIRERHPEAYAAWGRDPWAFRPEGGEGGPDLAARTLPAFARILAAHPAGPVAIVAHGGVNRIFLAHCLGMPLENLYRIGQGYAAVSLVEFHDGHPVVRLLDGGVRPA